ncbi:MAG: flavin reductase family protein [Comamonadaceae bacterium]|nr:MAG: flavin reductase family protein [Comamonadaceae bacterium]
MTDNLQGDFHYYEPAAGHGLKHDPFNALVGPRPIGWISSQDSEGRLNLAPYSFFNAFNYTPPIIGFASIGAKDSLHNIRQTGEFGWNLATRPLAEQMNASCAAVPPEVNEFELAGLTPVASRCIAVPRVGESPVSFECRLTQIVQLEGADHAPVETWLVLGEVVAIHIARHLIRDGVYDTAAAQPILRGGGPADYFEITADRMFKMFRPR